MVRTGVAFPTSPGGRTIRPAQGQDLDQVREIARAYDGLVHWPDRPDYLDHEREAGRLLVAVETERVIGFGATLERDGITHLSDLFIRPDRLGEGLGRALLTELLAGAGERTTFASQDPRALPLYIRFGMRPLWPLLYLKGDRAAARRLPGDALNLAPALTEEIAELDRHSSARYRPQDFQFLKKSGAEFFTAPSLPGAYGSVRFTLLERGLEAFIAPVGGRCEADAIRLALALVRRAAESAEVINIPPPGPHPALPALLGAGFQLLDRDTFMCSDPSLIDPGRYIPSPDAG